MKYLITGGTGTLGRELVRQLYKERENTKIVVYSRSESLQAEMQQQFPVYPDNRMQYVIGDVRDLAKITEATKGIDRVIHAAALKRIEVCEYNVEECLKTNILGTMNVIKACNTNGVKQCIVVSTDKAVSPINAYGASKLMAEKIAVGGNNLGTCHFAAVRYGNVLGSKGSVLELWDKQTKEGKELTVTNKEMTRFWITIEDAASFIIRKIANAERGFIYIPKIEKGKIYDMAKMMNSKIRIVAERPNEKLHEELTQKHEQVFESEDCYIITPHWHEWVAELPVSGEAKPKFNLTSEI